MHPGGIDTPMTRFEGVDSEAPFYKYLPLKRIGTAVEVAAAVLFLASDEARYVTGAEFAVDGGHLRRPRPDELMPQLVATVCITGAAGGIGLATRRLLEAQGDTVVGVDLRGAEIDADLGHRRRPGGDGRRGRRTGRAASSTAWWSAPGSRVRRRPSLCR